MTEHSVTHATFTIERSYDAPPAQVFRAFSDKTTKARWFGWPEDAEGAEFDLDFRVGGREISRGTMEKGPRVDFEATYHDIVDDERIVYSYDMHIDGRRISVSLATVELAPAGAGTTLTFTEQDAILDGLDTVEQREAGTRDLLDALARALAGDPIGA
jgi:uncharacterized protein YndB with AHSA1/START domain